MIIQVSTKHATGEYGPITSDKEIKPETIAQCKNWYNFIILKSDEYKVHYINVLEDTIWTDIPYSLHKTFPPNTVITFTQDSLT